MRALKTQPETTIRVMTIPTTRLTTAKEETKNILRTIQLLQKTQVHNRILKVQP